MDYSLFLFWACPMIYDKSFHIQVFSLKFNVNWKLMGTFSWILFKIKNIPEKLSDWNFLLLLIVINYPILSAVSNILLYHI